VIVIANLLICKVLQKPDVAGRMVRWAVKLSEFDVQYEPRGPIKGQVYVDFIIELSSVATHQEGACFRWVFSVDGSSNQQGSGAGVVLEGPDGLLIEQALRFAFKASNNQAEYEALIVGMLLAKKMGAKGFLAKSDSLLVTSQVTGEYQAKDPQMATYLEYVQVLKETFEVFKLVHVPREQNARVDLLAKFASLGKGGRQRTLIQETLKTPRTTADNMTEEVQQISTLEGVRRSHRSLTQETVKMPRVSVYLVAGEESSQVHQVDTGEIWMTPYQRYLVNEVLPLEPTKARKIKKNSNKYTLIDGKLFRHGFTHPILMCVSGEQCTRIMTELHEGICGSHVGGRSLSSKAIHAGYYCPTMREDCTRYA